MTTKWVKVEEKRIMGHSPNDNPAAQKDRTHPKKSRCSGKERFQIRDFLVNFAAWIRCFLRCFAMFFVNCNELKATQVHK